MKTSKATIISVLLFISQFSYSQDSRFIQLTVSDSVVLRTTGIVYEITPGNQMQLMGMKIPQFGMMDTTKPTISAEDITSWLDKGKFTYKVSGSSDYSISAQAAQPGILVMLKNENELKSLYKLLSAKQGITGKIKEISYEPLSKYYNDLYKRLYAKAMAQANMLAGITGNSVGKLISVSDVKNELDSILDWYKDLMKKMPIDLFGTPQISAKTEEVRMTFKFELK